MSAVVLTVSPESGMIESADRWWPCMDAEQLRDFATLAGELHFGRTARRRFTSPQTLSRRIQDLERELGVRLFQRTSRRVELTPAASQLLVRVLRILEELDGLRLDAHDLAAGTTGSLRMMYSAGTGEMVGKIVRQLRVEYPKVDTILEEGSSAKINEAVVLGKIDAGIVHYITLPAVSSLTIRTEPRNIIAMPLFHPLTGLSEVTLADLRGTTMLFSDPAIAGVEPNVEWLRGPWSAPDLDIAPRYELVLTESEFLDRVAAGLGILPVRSSVLRRNPRSDVAFRPFVGPTEEVPDLLIWSATKAELLVQHLVRVVQRAVASQDGSDDGCCGS